MVALNVPFFALGVTRMIRISSNTYFAIILLSLNALTSHCTDPVSVCEDSVPSPTLSTIAIILGIILLLLTALLMCICLLNAGVMIRNKIQGKQLVFI